jgi:membrane protein YdbS with pleckstrin-like domain
MRCAQCGFESTSGAAFCSRCGSRMMQPRPAMVREFAVTRLFPSWWRFSGSIFLALVLLGLAVQIFFTKPSMWRGAPAFVVASGAVFGLAWIARRSLSWALTSGRLIERRGLVSTRRLEMELADIRSVEVNRTLLQKLTGIGTVTVASAASADFAIRLEDIGEPDRIAEAIRQARLKRMQ